MGMAPALGQYAFAIGPVKQEFRPGLVIHGGGIGWADKMRLATAAKLDFRARAAMGAGNKQHG